VAVSDGNPTARYLRTLSEAGAGVDLSDGQLLDRFVASGEGVFLDALVQRHGPMVWGVCRRVLRDRHDAEDAFQATFLVLARRAAAVRSGDKIGNWLYGVAFQTARKARAMRAKRWTREGRTPDADPPTTDAPPNELASVIDAELNRLPDKYRVPIVLCELEGKTHGEVAEQLGWPVGTVSGRLSRAKALLAERLTRRGVTIAGGVALAAILAPELSAGMPALLPIAVTPSPNVELLTQEVLNAMRLTKLFTAVKLTAAGLLGCALLGFGLWGSGPRADAKPPAERTYRVTATDVMKEDDTVVTQITLDIPTGTTVELTNDKGKMGGFTFSAGEPKKGEESIPVKFTILADQVEPKKGATNVVKFVVVYKLGGVSGSISDTVPMPADAKKLADVLTVHVASGDYKAGEATKFVTFNGTTYSLRITPAK